VKAGSLSVLLVADTHLGLDLPLRPRVKRRRRGYDFLRNFEQALEPALHGQVDVVVHGGDLLDRPRVSERLLETALRPLLSVAKAGVPVFLVPGNHERRRIPLRLWTVHPNLHVFRKPCTFVHAVGDVRVAMSGFPSPRHIRGEFRELVRATAHDSVRAGVHLLCVHAAVEGAQVGAHDFTFRHGPDVIAGSDVPSDFAAVLAGHIHRRQTLTRDLRGRALGAPVIYPGSVERTSFAERNEDKGYVIADFIPTENGRGELVGCRFHELSARPMVCFDLQVDAMSPQELSALLRERFAALDPHAVVRIRVVGSMSPEVQQSLSAPQLRCVAPKTMNVSVTYPKVAPRERR
jgi:DNA repair exonuclease SbcCD nuclease subunit